MARSLPSGDRSNAADAAAQIAEIGTLLARGLVRLRARQSSETTVSAGESSLAYVGRQSRHPNPERERITDG
jgi:hypothetical protein